MLCPEKLIFLVFSILVDIQEIKKTEIIIFLLGRDQAYLDLLESQREAVGYQMT